MSDAEGGAPSQEGQPQQEAGTAEHWFAVMHSGAPTDQEVAAFTAWRRANPDHARAYHDLEQAWMRAGDHADHPEIKKCGIRPYGGAWALWEGQKHLSEDGIFYL